MKKRGGLSLSAAYVACYAHAIVGGAIGQKRVRVKVRNISYMMIVLSQRAQKKKIGLILSLARLLSLLLKTASGLTVGAL